MKPGKSGCPCIPGSAHVGVLQLKIGPAPPSPSPWGSRFPGVTIRSDDGFLEVLYSL